MKEDLKKIEKKYSKQIKDIFAILLFFCNSIFSSLLISILHINIKQITEKQSMVFSLFNYVMLVIIFILLYRKDLKEDWKKFKKEPNKIIDTGFKYWTIGLFFMVISNIIIMKFFPGSTANNEQAVQGYIKNFPFLALLTTSILGPFVEEITFRKTFKDSIKNPVLFILTSGILFGLMHVLGQSTTLRDYLYIIPYSALGISFAYMYYKTDNFYTSAMMHTIHNLALTIISIISFAL